jgi:hypothetical protein
MPQDPEGYLLCKIACFWDFIRAMKHYIDWSN